MLGFQVSSHTGHTCLICAVEGTRPCAPQGSTGLTELHPAPNWDFKESFQTPWAKFPQGSEAKKQRGQRRAAGTFPTLCSLRQGCRVALGLCRESRIRELWVRSRGSHKPLHQAAGGSSPSMTVPAQSFCYLPIPHLYILPCRLLPVTVGVRVGLEAQSLAFLWNEG